MKNVERKSRKCCIRNQSKKVSRMREWHQHQLSSWISSNSIVLSVYLIWSPSPCCPPFLFSIKVRSTEMSKTSPAWSLLKARESLTIRGSSPSCRVMAKIGVHLMESREQIIYVDWSCYFFLRFSSVQLLSCVRLFVTPWTSVQVTPWTSVQFSRSVVSDSLRPHEPQHARPSCPPSVMPSNHLILCHPLLLLLSIFPSIRVFSNESALPIKWPKYWSFSFNISPSNDIQDWFPS